MDKVDIAIERLKTASQMSFKIYKQPLVITTSGGKDSSVCLDLAKKSGIPFEVIHNHTTVDAPETVYFIREEFKRFEEQGIKCTINYPYYKGVKTSMWQLIPQKLIPPTRITRYCCDILKENGGNGRFIVTGVRWAESKSRQKNRGIYEAGKKLILNNDNDEKRQLFETCKLKAKRVCNPIVDWTDSEVLAYIRNEHLTINPLYECGFMRIGCIGCPMAKKKSRYKEFAMYPKYKISYIKAFDRMIQERMRRGKINENWRMGTTGEDVFHWWMEDGVLQGQMEIEEMMEDE